MAEVKIKSEFQSVCGFMLLVIILTLSLPSKFGDKKVSLKRSCELLKKYDESLSSCHGENIQWFIVVYQPQTSQGLRNQLLVNVSPS